MLIPQAIVVTRIRCSLSSFSSVSRATRIRYVPVLLRCMLMTSVSIEIDYAFKVFRAPYSMVA